MWMEMWWLVKDVKCDLKCDLLKANYFNFHEDFKILGKNVFFVMSRGDHLIQDLIIHLKQKDNYVYWVPYLSFFLNVCHFL